jgi:hypothetical protein
MGRRTLVVFENGQARLRVLITQGVICGWLMRNRSTAGPTLESPIGERGALRLDATQPLDELQQRLSAWWRTRIAVAIE